VKVPVAIAGCPLAGSTLLKEMFDMVKLHCGSSARAGVAAKTAPKAAATAAMRIAFQIFRQFI
jgi:hypothetical protein